MPLVQIQRRTLVEERAPRGEEPFFELELEANQEIVDIRALPATDHVRRETVDNRAWVWVATRL